ncbi:hypothetical protein L218DRAFT_944699 [Marasmius fiardii PR-910]|nr:hypothetical protein L218DRAFT_944699 [Marasmius fiardii PR-910]
MVEFSSHLCLSWRFPNNISPFHSLWWRLYQGFLRKVSSKEQNQGSPNFMKITSTSSAFHGTVTDMPHWQWEPELVTLLGSRGNDIWCIDQYNKWKKFGPGLNTGVDSFIGQIKWLKEEEKDYLTDNEDREKISCLGSELENLQPLLVDQDEYYTGGCNRGLGAENNAMWDENYHLLPRGTLAAPHTQVICENKRDILLILMNRTRPAVAVRRIVGMWYIPALPWAGIVKQRFMWVFKLPAQNGSRFNLEGPNRMGAKDDVNVLFVKVNGVESEHHRLLLAGVDIYVPSVRRFYIRL